LSENLTSYEPDNSLKKGHFSVFKEIYDEINRSRWLIYQLFRREFYTTYVQSIFGVLWAFITPILSVATFVVLNMSGVFNVGNTKVPYPLFALLGLTFWQLLSTGVVACSSALVKAGSMIVKINFSKKALVIASMGQAIVAFLVQAALVLFLFVYYGIWPSAAILLIPLIIIPLVLLTLGLGLILSLLNSVVRDFGNLLPLLMTFLLFLTPVLYIQPTTGILAQLFVYNPIFYLISVPRDLVLGNIIASGVWLGFLLSSVLSVALFAVCLVAFHLTETRIAERI
jgi:lipopolysaccharide transport system permease protein